jgi:trans-2,3-dihydro-3-hydroxyanthranilate isomerase
MPAFRYVVCDVFTDVPLAGNQLAVFTDAREIPEEQLQRLAKEMNFAETTLSRGHREGDELRGDDAFARSRTDFSSLSSAS